MGKVRIIGGLHRSRQLPVLDSPGLRPTLDRVKETLFNWLGQDLTAQECLDLFAGSGSLGFEALSRNASQVVMVEQDGQVASQLQKNVELLKLSNCTIWAQDALSYLRTNNHEFDVIFLDPPYATDLLFSCLPLVAFWLKPGGRVYIEYTTPPQIGPEYIIYKQAKAGKVNYALLGLKE